jgi:hypothetical protein
MSAENQQPDENNPQCNNKEITSDISRRELCKRLLALSGVIMAGITPTLLQAKESDKQPSKLKLQENGLSPEKIQALEKVIDEMMDCNGLI